MSASFREMGRAAIVRATRGSLVDTAIIPTSGHLHHSLFVDCSRFPDGSPKTRSDTNMEYSGVLGYPREFNVESVEIVFAKSARPDDIKRVAESLRVEFAIGITVIFSDPFSAFVPLFQADGADDAVKTFLGRKIKTLADDGCWTHFSRDVRSAGRPLRINSTTTIKLGLDCNAGALSNPIRLKGHLVGTMFNPY